MEIKVGNFCPLIGKDCIELKCKFFCKIAGTNKNTGREIEEWNCAIGFIPMLLIENSSTNRETGAAIESFRNETVKANAKKQEVMAQMLLPFREKSFYEAPRQLIGQHDE